MDESKIKETLEKQLQLLSKRKKSKRTIPDSQHKDSEMYSIKRSLILLSVTLLVQSILLLRVVLQIREIYSILLLLTERLNLLS